MDKETYEAFVRVLDELDAIRKHGREAFRLPDEMDRDYQTLLGWAMEMEKDYAKLN